MHRTRERNGPRALNRSLRGDESGIALIYVTMMLPVIIGFSLLAIDVARFSILNSSLQHGADALALAGAAELDGRPDAISRSTSAMRSFVTNNDALFSSTNAKVDWSAVDPARLCFLRELPASDATAIDPANCLSTTPANIRASSLAARYVRVAIAAQDYDLVFPISFLGGISNSAGTGGEAVAGFTPALCNFTPLFICNPFEPAGNTDVYRTEELFAAGILGRQIKMKQTGGASAEYFPGNFGLLVPAGAASAGTSTIRDWMAQVRPPSCAASTDVDLRTGAAVSIRTGLNVRFDIYEGSFSGSSFRRSADYRPARNVRKGMETDTGSPCRPDDGDGVGETKLPRDNCFATASCPHMEGRMGDGNWNRALYWSTAHNGAAWPSDLSSTASRYEVYKYELANYSRFVADDSNGRPVGGEVGNPQCWSGDTAVLADSPDRRIIQAAMLNCNALDVSTEYGPIRGRTTDLPAAAFGRFFLTEPVASSSGSRADREIEGLADGDIWAEFAGVVEPGSGDGVVRDIVQLYR